MGRRRCHLRIAPLRWASASRPPIASRSRAAVPATAAPTSALVLASASDRSRLGAASETRRSTKPSSAPAPGSGSPRKFRAGGQPLQLVEQHGLPQRFLGREMPVERARPNPGPAGHVVKRHGQPIRGERGARRGQDPLAGRGVRPRAAAGL